MKSIDRSYLLIITFLLFFVSSCREPKDLVYKDFQNLRVEKLGFASSLLKLDLNYYNPNNFGLQLKRADLDIFINNTFMGHAIQEYQVTIPKRGDFTLPIQMEVDMKNLFRNALSTILNNEVSVKVTGTIKLGKLNVFKSIPVNYEGNQKFTVF